MKLNVRILMALTLLGASFVASAYSVTYVRKYDLSTYYIATRYVQGGETMATAKARSGATAVLKGSYFAPNYNPIVNIDLTVVNGSVKVPSRTGSGPTLISIGQQTRIVESNEAQKCCTNVTGAYGITGAKVPVYPTSKHDRHLVVVRNNILYDIQLKNATYKNCQTFIAKYGLSKGKIIYLDGGRSLRKDIKMPSHILIMKRQKGSGATTGTLAAKAKRKSG